MENLLVRHLSGFFVGRRGGQHSEMYRRSVRHPPKTQFWGCRMRVSKTPGYSSQSWVLSSLGHRHNFDIRHVAPASSSTVTFAMVASREPVDNPGELDDRHYHLITLNTKNISCLYDYFLHRLAYVFIHNWKCIFSIILDRFLIHGRITRAADISWKKLKDRRRTSKSRE